MATFASKCLLCLVKVEPEPDCEPNLEDVEESVTLPSAHFLCETVADSDPVLNEDETLEPIKRTSSILQKQVDVIFLLKHVLQLPTIQLCRYLKVRGNPETWINVCGTCQELVKTVKEMFQLLQMISKKYDEARTRIKERIKGTNLMTEDDLDTGDDFILDECRKTVCKRTAYVQETCFRKGDFKAHQQLQKVRRRQEHQDEDGKFEQLTENFEFERTPSKTKKSPESSKILKELEIIEEKGPPKQVPPSVRRPAGSTSSALTSKRNFGKSLKPPPLLRRSQSQTCSEVSSKTNNKVILVYPGKSQPSTSKKPQSCRVCQKILKTAYALRAHLLRVHEIVDDCPPKTFKCAVEGCEKLFFERKRFIQHKDWHKKIPTCDICRKEFVNQYNLDRHDFLIHKIVKPNTKNLKCYDCPKCEFRTHKEKYQESHTLTCKGIGGEGGPEAEEIGPDKNFQCPHCGKFFIGEYRLTQHIRGVHPPNSEWKHICELCPDKKKFRVKSFLDRHMAHEHQVGTEDYVCTKCGIFYGTKVARKFHVCGKPDNKCDICGSEFKERYRLKRHIAAIHEKRLSISCDLCMFRTPHRVVLLNHKASKHKIGIKCEKENCSRFFASKWLLERHVKLMHDRIFSVNCDLCDHRTMTRTTLKKHKATKHNIGIKCEVEGCSKVVAFQRQLEEHLKRVHPQGEREKSFLCTECGKGFHDQKAFAVHHQAMHLNRESKPYKCRVCGKGFSTSTYRSVHMRIHRKQGVKATVTPCSNEVT